MALSGSFTTTSLTEYGCTVSFTFAWSATQSITNNQSTITWSLTTNMNPSTYARGVRKVYITIDSTQIFSQTWSYDSMKSVTGGTSVGSSTYTVTHEPDGTKSFNFNVYVNVGRSSENSWTNTATGKSVTLDTIPRASTMALSPADPTTLSTITATVSRASDSFTHRITTSYNNTTYPLGTTGTNTFSGTSVSFTIPTGIRSDMKTANSASVVLPLTLTTYSGTTVIGTKDYSLTIKAPMAELAISPSSVACNANTTWTLSNTDTNICTYTVTRAYDGTVRYTDQTKGTTTSKSVANSTFEQYITASPSGTITVKVTTYVGTTEVGSVSKDYTCTIPTGTYKPTLTIANQLSRVNKVSYTYISGITFLAGYDGATGTVTEGKANSSHADITSRVVEVSGNKATRTYSISGSTATISVNTFQASNTDYNVTVTYKVTDARGGYAEVSFNAVTIRGYSKPTFSSYLVQRANSSGEIYSEGTYANISASASAHTVKNTSNAELNSMRSITYKLGTTGTEQTSGASTSGLNGTIAKTAYGNGQYYIANQYTFTMTATDALGLKTVVSYVLPKAVIALSLHKNTGVGLGTVAERGYITTGIPFKGTVTVSDSTASSTLDGGSIFAGTSSTRRLTGATNGVETTAGKIFFYAGVEGTGTSASRGIAIGAPATAANRIVEVSTSNEVSFKGTATTAVQAAMAIKLGSTSVGNSSKPIYINGGTATRVDVPASGSWFKGVPQVGSDGVMEIGAYIDFHATNTTTADYDVRLQADGTRLLCSKEFRPESLTKLYYGTYYPRRWCYGVSTRSSNDSITAGYYMYVPMNTTTAENPVIASGGTKLFGSASGGIKVFRAGKYKVSGAIYMGTGSNGRAGAYIFKSTAAFSTAGTRVRSPPSTSQEMVKMVMYGNGTDIVASVSPKVLTLAANDIIHLVARPVTSNGTVYYTNNSTYLLVEWLSD